MIAPMGASAEKRIYVVLDMLFEYQKTSQTNRSGFWQQQV
jgi:hypothetical protein